MTPYLRHRPGADVAPRFAEAHPKHTLRNSPTNFVQAEVRDFAGRGVQRAFAAPREPSE